jgi:hypothetical protein
MRKKGADGLCITQGRQPCWHPWCTTGHQEGCRPSWWEPGPGARAPDLMVPGSSTRAPIPLGEGVGAFG